jgi:hypothetical protein
MTFDKMIAQVDIESYEIHQKYLIFVDSSNIQFTFMACWNTLTWMFVFTFLVYFE